MKLLASLALAAASLQGAVAAPSAGCGKTPTTPQNVLTNITVGAKQRQFILKLPEGYDNKKPYRLVYTFHALGGSAQQIASGGAGAYYGIPPLANNSAIFVSPNGQTSGSAFQGVMGWGNAGGEDIAFVEAMHKALVEDLCVNTDLVFSTGFSYGGAISYSIVCSLPKVFRAVGVLSGGTMSGCAGGGPKEPIAYYEQHGTKDQVLNVAMARGMRDAMIKLNGCKAVTPEQTPPAGGHLKTVYEGCDPKYPLTWTIFDGQHTPSPKDTGASGTFTAGYVWEFFSQFK